MKMFLFNMKHRPLFSIWKITFQSDGVTLSMSTNVLLYLLYMFQGFIILIYR